MKVVIGFVLGLVVGVVLTGHEATGYWPWPWQDEPIE